MVLFGEIEHSKGKDGPLCVLCLIRGANEHGNDRYFRYLSTLVVVGTTGGSQCLHVTVTGAYVGGACHCHTVLQVGDLCDW